MTAKVNKLLWAEAARIYNSNAKKEAARLDKLWQEDKNMREIAGKAASLLSLGLTPISTVGSLMATSVGVIVTFLPELPKPIVLGLPESLDNLPMDMQQFYWNLAGNYFGTGNIDIHDALGDRPIDIYSVFDLPRQCFPDYFYYVTADAGLSNGHYLEETLLDTHTRDNQPAADELPDEHVFEEISESQSDSHAGDSQPATDELSDEHIIEEISEDQSDSHAGDSQPAADELSDKHMIEEISEDQSDSHAGDSQPSADELSDEHIMEETSKDQSDSHAGDSQPAADELSDEHIMEETSEDQSDSHMGHNPPPNNVDADISYDDS